MRKRFLPKVLKLPRRAQANRSLQFRGAANRAPHQTVRPGRRTVFEEYPHKVSGVAQRFDHRPALADDFGEIILSGHAIAKRRTQAMPIEAFYFCNFNHRRVPRTLASGVPSRARHQLSSNSPRCARVAPV